MHLDKKMATKVNYDVLIHRTIRELIVDLRENVFYKDSDEKADLLLVEIFFEKQEPMETMSHVIKNIAPWEDQIFGHKKSFFLENADIFAGLPVGKVEKIAKFIVSGSLTEASERVIWMYFETIVNLARKHRGLDMYKRG
jgi:hypothetical protein